MSMNIVQASNIERLMGKQRVPSLHDPAHEYGERSWRLDGELFDVVYWDCGNGWAWVQQIILWQPPNDATEEDVRWEFAPSKEFAEIYRELACFFDKLAKEASGE